MGKSDPEAERMTSPVSFSFASTRYKKDNLQITEKITDSGFNQMLVAPLSMIVVELEGTGMADNKELQAFLTRTDLTTLAALK
jgi:hypothetical protein